MNSKDLDLHKIKSKGIDKIFRTEKFTLRLEAPKKELGEKIDWNNDEVLKISIFGDGFDQSYLISQDRVEELIDYLRGLEEEGFFEKEEGPIFS